MTSENKLIHFLYVDFVHINLDTTIRTLKLDEVQGRIWHLNGLDHWATVGSNFIVKVWKLSKSEELNEIFTIPFHEDAITELVYASKIDCIISASMDGTLKMWSPSFRLKHSEKVRNKLTTAIGKSSRRERKVDGIRGTCR